MCQLGRENHQSLLTTVWQPFCSLENLGPTNYVIVTRLDLVRFPSQLLWKSDQSVHSDMNPTSWNAMRLIKSSYTLLIIWINTLCTDVCIQKLLAVNSPLDVKLMIYSSFNIAGILKTLYICVLPNQQCTHEVCLSVKDVAF